MKNFTLKGKNRFIFLCLLALILTIGIIQLYAPKTTASAVSVSNYDSFTNNEKLVIEDIKYERDKYSDLFYAKTSYIKGGTWNWQTGGDSSFRLVNGGDDYITKIVPKELFAEENDGILHIGKYYGFFISTKPMGNNFQSTVLVFDIITDTDLPKTTDRIEVTVKPIFQYTYAYLKPSESLIKFKDALNMTMSGNNISNHSELNYSISQPLVIALPIAVSYTSMDYGAASASSATYGMVENYYLSDISFAASLYNEQELNVGDAGYDPYNDVGSYITSYDYTYKGKYREYGKFSSADAFRFGADAVAYALGNVPGVGWVYGGFALTADAAKLGLNIANATVGNIVEIDKGKLTVTNFYENRDDQLRYYRDNNGNPFLTKSAGVAINTAAEKTIWYGVGGDDNATAYFKINHSALNGQTAYNTSVLSEVGLKVVKADGDSVVAKDTGCYVHHVREKLHKGVQEGLTTAVMFQNGTSYFKFTPEKNGNYLIDTNKGHSVSVSKTENINIVRGYLTMLSIRLIPVKTHSRL